MKLGILSLSLLTAGCLSIATAKETVVINPDKVYQSIDGFGASDAWSMRFVGEMPQSTQNAVADLLFSSDTYANRNPKGIGLSIWRFNIGAGSVEQGDSSQINFGTRTDCFLNPDGTYDWNKQAGQRRFLKLAKERGVPYLLGFLNSPPVYFTQNGLATNTGRGGTYNLQPDKYGDFARFMADVIVGLKQHDGITIDYISPVNEPQYNWDSGQEGSGWTNDEVAALARELDMSLDDRGLSTDILLGESGDWEYLYKVKGDANRSNIFSAFFTPGSSAYVGDLAHVKNLICGHSYWTDGTWDGMRNVRKQVAQAAGQYNLDVWQSEWSMLGDNYSSSEFVGYEQASEMDIAFYMSKVIHNDLTVAGVSSWSYWTSMDVSRWGHKNRFLLISLVPAGGEYGDIEQEGSYQATATLWVLGNYSRFIRPGYRRIALDLNESRTFFGSAWLSPEGDKVVAVYTNMSDKAVRLGETHVGWSNEAKSIATYTTTGSKNLVEGTVAAGKQVILEAKSVTTVVYSLK